MDMLMLLKELLVSVPVGSSGRLAKAERDG